MTATTASKGTERGAAPPRPIAASVSGWCGTKTRSRASRWPGWRSGASSTSASATGHRTSSTTRARAIRPPIAPILAAGQPSDATREDGRGRQPAPVRGRLGARVGDRGLAHARPGTGAVRRRRVAAGRQHRRGDRQSPGPVDGGAGVRAALRRATRRGRPLRPGVEVRRAVDPGPPARPPGCRRRGRPGRDRGDDVPRGPGVVRRQRSTCCTSTASTTTGRCATTSAGRPASRIAAYCWCTTRSRRSGSLSPCSAPCRRSGRLAYAGRTGSLARLEVRRPTAAERARPLREVPWWVRNLVVKALLRLRMRAVARLLGHTGAADPY